MQPAHENSLVSGTTQQVELNIRTSQSLSVPVPPLAEQHRIVAKVDELMVLCDELEQKQVNTNAAHQTLVETLLAALTTTADQKEFAEAWQRIAHHFDTLLTTEYSVELLKQTILQLAVMGKLGPQDPNDEPADHLLIKIRELRSRSAEKGDERESESLAPIEEIDYPFEIKSNWKWVRLGEIHNVTSSKRIHARDYVSQGVPFYRSKEIGELGRGQDVSTNIFITEEAFDQLRPLPGFPKQGDLMLASIGASIGNNWITDQREFYYKDGNVTKISSHDLANMRYLQFFFDIPLLVKQISEGVAGSAYNALTIIKIKNLLFPLPPLAEQHRIVAKVDELMVFCDALKARLKDTQTTQVYLADAIVEQSVA
jgi:type I restriction enzyme S subunit